MRAASEEEAEEEAEDEEEEGEEGSGGSPASASKHSKAEQEAIAAEAAERLATWPVVWGPIRDAKPTDGYGNEVPAPDIEKVGQD